MLELSNLSPLGFWAMTRLWENLEYGLAKEPSILI